MQPRLLYSFFLRSIANNFLSALSFWAALQTVRFFNLGISRDFHGLGGPLHFQGTVRTLTFLPLVFPAPSDTLVCEALRELV